MVPYSVRLYAQEIPLYMLVDEIDKEYKFSGYIGENWEIILHHLKFNISDVYIDDMKTPLGEVYSKTNGSYCVGFLLRNESDFCVSSVYPNSKAFDLIEYSSVIQEHSIKLFSTHPIFELNKQLAIAGGLQNQVCFTYTAVLVISYLLWGICLTYFSRVWPRRLKYDFKNVIWRGVSITLGQGFVSSPRYCAERVGWFSFLLGSFLFLGAYSSVLLSRLTLSSAYRYYERLQDLYDYPNVDLAVAEFANEYNYFLENQDKAILKWISKINVRTIKPETYIETFNGFKDGTLLIASAEDTGIIIMMALEYVSPSQPVYIPESRIYVQHLYYVFSKNLPQDIKEMFECTVLRLTNSGLLFHSFNRDVRWYKDRAKHFLPKDSTKVLAWKSLNFLVIILAMGLAFALFLKLREVLK